MTTPTTANIAAATSHRAIRVVVADDHASLRGAIVDLINSEPDMTVVGSGGDADVATDLAREFRPDVVVVDVNMPGGGWAAARTIRDRGTSSRVIAYSAHTEALVLRTMQACGLDAFVSKTGHIDLLLAAIRGQAVPAPEIRVAAPLADLIARSARASAGGHAA